MTIEILGQIQGEKVCLQDDIKVEKTPITPSTWTRLILRQVCYHWKQSKLDFCKPSAVQNVMFILNSMCDKTDGN